MIAAHDNCRITFDKEYLMEEGKLILKWRSYFPFGKKASLHFGLLIVWNLYHPLQIVLYREVHFDFYAR